MLFIKRILVTGLYFWIIWLTAQSQFDCKVTFLNDRASSVIGAKPLAARGFVSLEGLTGEKQIVAIADSGLGNGQMDNPHPDLKSQPGKMPKVIMLKSWAGRKTPDDPDGHGTHMAATVAGTGEASNGKFAGIAYGASIYFQAILNPEGKPSPPRDLSSLFQPAYAAAARIHLDGWGSKGNYYSSNAAQVDAFVHQHPDFLVIFGAGNDGPQKESLTCEANSKNALVVGATEGVRPAFGLNEDNANEVASFSSRGPTPDSRIKPDLVAPGTGIISAASPLIKSTSTDNPLYTRMQGTSQAAAVTAGAAALLREYFQEEEKINSPSAALLKAALINGAKPIPGEGAGFGRLNLAATVLALKEKSFLYIDEQYPLNQGKTRSYCFEVANHNQTFTATLTWTDLPAPPGATKTLVNDLDLAVISPTGKKYLGNDIFQKGIKDEVNNVEQVKIPYPEPGIYTIEVKAASITKVQSFALVFGQLLNQEIVAGVNNNTIKLASGGKVTLPKKGKNVLGLYLAPWDTKHIFPGEDVYIGKQEQNLYLIGNAWRTTAAQNLPLPSGTLLIEADTKKMEGGFYLNPQVSILANGQKLDNIDLLPSGVPVLAIINPSSQTIWWVKSDYLVKEGILKEIDKRKLFLFNDHKSYNLAQEAVFSFTDLNIYSSLEDKPFGAPVFGTIEQLAPGMLIQLIISPKDNEVGYVAVRRSIATGKIKSVGEDKITLEGGKSYRVIKGAPVTLDGKSVSLSELRTGTHTTLVLAEDLVISVMANSEVNYGQVVFFNYKENKLYFLDYLNRLHTLTISPQVEFFRWWQPGEINLLLPGNWVRLTLAPQSKKISRIDVAEAEKEQKGKIISFDPEKKMVIFSSKIKGFASLHTHIIKNGYPVQIEDILPGEKVEFTLLQVPKSSEKIIASVKGYTSVGVKAPLLQVSCQTRLNTIIISGMTEGEYIYIYTEDRQVLKLRPEKNGRFITFLKRPKGKTLQVVTTERRFGGVSGMYVTIPEPAYFNDIAGHPAQKEIEALARQGLLKGYPDGTFRPDQEITRAEFVAIIARILGLNDLSSNKQVFKDRLPSWAAREIILAFHRGIVKGYPGGNFFAQRAISGYETINILSRAISKTNTSTSRGWSTFQSSLLTSKGLTRARAAKIIYCIINS